MKEKTTLSRLRGFVNKNGGVYVVAAHIGRSPQLFYSMYRRESMPGLGLLLLMQDKYEDFDLNYIATGQRSAILPTASL